MNAMKGTADKINEYIIRIKNGDISAIGPLHLLVGAQLRLKSLKYFDNDPIADDALQEFWIRIEKYCKKYRFVGNGLHFLERIFDNLCKEISKKEQRKRSTISIEAINLYEENLVVDDDLSHEQIALRQSFAKAQGLMSPEVRQVFNLTLYGEMSVREIAKACGFSKSKAARLRNDGIAILKQTLIADGWDKPNG